ncbi:MAG TPA: aldo/keto reductase [Candidatus Lokiarchaeia archaeon]|nr:aldo/keto reductase [Candidatus Lokiarchaeia archaeon]
MKRRFLGTTGIQTSTIGMGCWAFGGGDYWGEQDQASVNELVGSALDLGINYFDTAEMYNNGASETALGIALAGRRDEAIIGSKISPSNCQPESIRAHLDASLERLETDYIDVYMLHWPIEPHSIEHFTKDEASINNPPTVEDAFATLNDLQQDGKICHVAVSNHGVEQMQAVLATGITIVANEIAYNLFSRAIEAEIMPFTRENGISIIGTMALQQGILSGAFDRIEDIPPPQAHSRHFKQERGWDEITQTNYSRHDEEGCEQEMLDALVSMKGIAEQEGVTVAQLSLAWVMANPAVACTLVGSRTMAELQENVKAADYEMPASVYCELNEISQPIWDKLGNNPDYYESRANTRIH